MPVRAVTFDAAGTLLAPHPGVGAVYAEVAAAHGLERSAADLDQAFPAAFASARARWAVPYGADEEDARRFWGAVIEATFGEPLPYEIAVELYDTFAEPRRWRVLPGVREALALVAGRGLPMAVVSNFDRRLDGLLRGCGLGPFAVVVVSSMVGAAKPAPAALHAACGWMGVPAEGVLHLGDSAREDGAMCTAAGARWLAVDPGQGIPLAPLRAILDAP